MNVTWLKLGTFFLSAPILPVEGKLVPLTDSVSQETWGEFIGFGAHPSNILSVPLEHWTKAHKFKN